MPGINPTKELYMAKSIEELQKLCSVPNKDPSKLVKVSEKLLESANENEPKPIGIDR